MKKIKCKECGKAISKERLAILKSTKLCVKCSQKVGTDLEAPIKEVYFGSNLEGVGYSLK